jgi:uncharacterized membrane protein YdcZ (DUF606 family)
MLILIPILSGVLITFNMAVNSKIAQETNLLEGVFINYFFGLSTIFLISLFIQNNFSFAPTYEYLGGVIGVIVIFLSNYIVPKIPVIYTSFLILTGQVFIGIIFDFLFYNNFQIFKIIGTIFMFLGFLYLFIFDLKKQNIF